MDKTTETIISKLKGYKTQGLSYYQAAQELLKLGYSQAQIDDAEDNFNYNAPSTGASESLQNSPKPSKPNILTQNYSSHGELWYRGNSGIALILLLVIVVVLLTLWLAGII